MLVVVVCAFIPDFCVGSTRTVTQQHRRRSLRVTWQRTASCPRNQRGVVHNSFIRLLVYILYILYREILGWRRLATDCKTCRSMRGLHNQGTYLFFSFFLGGRRNWRSSLDHLCAGWGTCTPHTGHDRAT